MQIRKQSQQKKCCAQGHKVLWMLCVRSDSQTLLWGRVTSYFSSCWESFGECLSARTFSQPKKDTLPKVMLCSQGQCTSNDWFMRRTKTCSLCLNLGYHRRAIPASEPSMGSSVNSVAATLPFDFSSLPGLSTLTTHRCYFYQGSLFTSLKNLSFSVCFLENPTNDSWFWMCS